MEGALEKHKKVSIKLTEEQKRLIKEGTGHNIQDLWVTVEGGNAVGRQGGLQSEMEEGGRVEQRERNDISYPARSGR
jgi:hypothetical protein